ncbi:SDR family NAD(P)-dependent oxidoreductase [Vibrio variabilis]|uniref:SDR family NAD(P)-dependent oxidoreductase n=1 Tax=Vibrio variabilis TaxID=990271 RepID=UPI000DDA1C2F|nr:SDR family oxidoreductase [Vibrio variabilis]
MANTALITGASSGIGLEFAKIHAQKGGDMVLVARSADKLEALKQELENQFKIKVTVLPADLSKADSAAKIFEQTEAQGLKIDTLINNAGFGGHGLFHERELVDEQAMMQVNMLTLTDLTHFYLKGMVERNQGRILNVSSTASFMPGPLQAVYYATKAYVTSFSQAIAEEVKDNNITVTALCPGAVATGFVEAANLEGVEIFDKAKSPKSVAECGYQAMEKGDLVAFNESSLKFMLNWIVPLLPRRMVLKLSRQAMEKNG